MELIKALRLKLKEVDVAAIANIGSSFMIALPPTEIWMTDVQAAEFLGYGEVHFRSNVCCLPNFPKPRYVIKSGHGRRWNLAEVSDWLKNRSEDEPKTGRPRKR